jgi:hypothetical protein
MIPARAMALRPRPPDELLTVEGLMTDTFVPAPEVHAWVLEQYLDPKGSLYYAGHQPLANATLAFLWTNCQFRRRTKTVVGQADLVSNLHGSATVWTRARAEQQLRAWFPEPPDFLITLDAVFADQAEDAAFAALIDHELCHCVQATDEFGAPRFNKMTSQPIWAVRGHDVEEFVSVVERFGVEAAGQAAIDFVIAASKTPLIGPARLAQACGTCLRLVA